MCLACGEQRSGFTKAEVQTARLRVRAGNRPQAPILERGVLDREPKADAGLRLRVEEGGVLMEVYRRANPRRLANIHRLHDRRLRVVKRRHEITEAVTVREPSENRVQFMKRCRGRGMGCSEDNA